MTGDPIPSRRLRKVRRRVAARLDLAGHDLEADTIRRMSIPELITLDHLEAAPTQ